MSLTVIFLSQLFQFSSTVLNIFVFFAMGWLYFDSWHVDKSKPSPLMRAIGCFLVATASALYATMDARPELITLFRILELAGLSFIVVSLWTEPVLKIPGKKKATLILPILPLSFSLLATSLLPLIVLLKATIGIMYLYKTWAGLEKQLMWAGIGFLVLALGGLFSLREFWLETPIVFWSELVRNYGILWWIQHAVASAASIIIGVWIWGYIRFRLSIQLFLSTTLTIFSIFVIATGFFSYLLFKNIEKSALDHLLTDAYTFQYALEQVQVGALSNARAIAYDTELISSTQLGNTTAVQERSLELLTSSTTDFLLIASTSGEVLARAEDADSIGDSLIEDPVIISALAGQPLSIITRHQGTDRSQIVVSAATPISSDTSSTAAANIIGAVKTGYLVDNAFVDGVKDSTGLDVSIFSDDQRVATTFVSQDGTSRYIGTKESDNTVTDQVLGEGKPYVGSLAIFNQPYLAAYVPLKSYQDETIGMLFVGKPQATLIETIEKALSLTFMGSIVLMVISTIPSYFFARYLNKQLTA